MNITLLCFRSVLNLQDGYYYPQPTKPTGWTHIVLNFIGPNKGQGVWIYYDGLEVAGSSVKSEASHSPSDGRFVVGRYYTDSDQDYVTVQIDELTFFNHHLTLEEITTLGNETKLMCSIFIQLVH